MSRRTFVASLKAVIDSRHANTRRHNRRPPAEPWIGDMVVVKEYDQMESLRQILELPARTHPDPAESNSSDTIATTVQTDARTDEESTNTEHDSKRKRDAEEEGDGDGIIQDSKRRRVIDDVENHSDKDQLSPEPEAAPVNREKENIPPQDEVSDSTASTNNNTDSEGEMQSR
jgi:hypothetical protein